MALTYAADILPKFRLGDVNCMRRRQILLSDAGWMCSADATFGFADHGNARHVFDYLNSQGDSPMPPDGPWSQDWLDTYKNWMNGGFQQ